MGQGSKRYRAFSPDFVRHMSLRGAWPKAFLVRAYFKSRELGLRTNHLTDMRNGRVVPEKDLLGLIECLQDGWTHPSPAKNCSLRHCSKEFVEFISTNHGIDAATANGESLIEFVCGPLTTRPHPAQDVRDYVGQSLMRALGKILRLGVRADAFVQSCRDERAVAEAVRWMFITLGEEIWDTKNGSLEDAVRAAESHMKITLQEYQARAISWWLVNPWTVVLVRGKKQPTGMCIVLPCSAAAYEEMLSGKKATYECTPQDLTVPSRHILVEGCGLRPKALGGEGGNQTPGIRATLLTQTAVLSRWNTATSADTLRIVSFAGTERSGRNLMEGGFRPTGRNMARTGLEFFRLDIGEGARGFAISAHDLILRGLGATLHTPPNE